MKNMIKYISIIAMSVHVVTIFSVDLDNFEDLSQKYCRSFNKKVFHYSPTKHFIKEYWPELGLATCIISGFTLGKVFPGYKLKVYQGAVVAGASVALAGQVLHNPKATYNIEEINSQIGILGKIPSNHMSFAEFSAYIHLIDQKFDARAERNRIELEIFARTARLKLIGVVSLGCIAALGYDNGKLSEAMLRGGPTAVENERAQLQQPHNKWRHLKEFLKVAFEFR